MMECFLSVVWQVECIHDPAIWYCVPRNTIVFTDRSCAFLVSLAEISDVKLGIWTFGLVADTLMYS